MGYTNYWNLKTNIKKFDSKFLEDAKKIIDDCGVELANYNGTAGTSPTINETLISFNGVGDDSHETFYINLKEPEDFSFCKTARKPYDVVVKCFLMLLQKYGYLTKPFSFDGNANEQEYIYAEQIFKSAIKYKK